MSRYVMSILLGRKVALINIKPSLEDVGDDTAAAPQMDRIIGES
jgi:hypothetical protein